MGLIRCLSPESTKASFLTRGSWYYQTARMIKQLGQNSGQELYFFPEHQHFPSKELDKSTFLEKIELPQTLNPAPFEVAQ